MRPTFLLAVLLAATAPAACKLVKNPDPAEEAAKAAAAAEGGGADVATMWTAQVRAAHDRGRDRLSRR